LAHASAAAVETRFGSFETDPRWVVTIPDGLPGFEKCRRFVLVTASRLEPLQCLQGLDEDKPSFLAIDPRIAQPGYAAVLSADDRQRLGLEDGSEPLLWLGLVTVRDETVLVNLRAPVVINPKRMIGLQVIDPDSAQPTDHPLTLD
jgi:flagellar assembly factor FliW